MDTRTETHFNELSDKIQEVKTTIDQFASDILEESRAKIENELTKMKLQADKLNIYLKKILHD
jgi:ElaB/YqjD/DUF883 family membrane-anchored ribosome-binding protein